MSATTLTYSKLITTNVANQAVSLADSGIMGHRVQVSMSVDDLNRFFIWNRPAGSPAPIGHFQQIDASGVNFNDMMLATLGKTYVDIDGVTNGLNFSSSILDANTDPRIRLNNAVGANDLCMAYLLYKCYGSSAASTLNVIYNLQDAQDMLTSGTLVLAIDSSLSTEEAKSSNPPGTDQGAVHKMFTDLLSADPTRFFTEAGIQISGLFEVAADTTSSGAWGFVENDKIEMQVQFTFSTAVTRTGTQDPSQALESSTNMQDRSSEIIKAGSTFTIRLQVTATDTPSGAMSKALASATATAIADAQKQQATANAASNALAAAAAAQEAVNAAMSQKSSADAAVAKTIATNAAQAIAVSNAQAALQAAQAALAAAKVSGNPANIQQQNAAAIAAQTAVTNAETIAKQAAAAVTNAQAAQAQAVASLNAAQTAAANAAAQVANTNAAAAAAAQKAAADSAAAAAAIAAAQTAASNPSTNALTQAQKLVLDPQTVATARATANAATATRVKAQENSVRAAAAAQTAMDALQRNSTELALVIARGGTLADIQIARSNVVVSTTTSTNAQAAAKAASLSLIQASNTELAAQQASANASAQRVALLLTIANAQVNTGTNALTTTTAAYNAAKTAFDVAKANAAAATVALNAAVASGQTMQQTQTLTAASLAANRTLDEVTMTFNAAEVAISGAQFTLQNDVDSAADAAQSVTDDAVASAQAIALIQTNITLANNYQTNINFVATVNQQSQQLNKAQIAMFTALINNSTAKSVLDQAKNDLTSATTAGGTGVSLVLLQQKVSQASAALTNSNTVYNEATNAYNAILAQLQTTANEATLVYTKARTQVLADTAAATSAVTAATAAAADLVVKNAAVATASAKLNTDIIGNVSAATIATDISAYKAAAAAAVSATLANKNAQIARVAAENKLATNTAIVNNGVFGIFDASGSQIVLDASGNPIVDQVGNAILQAAASMQLTSITDATTTNLVTTYIALVAAYNDAQVAANAAAQQADSAAKALTNGITAGLSFEELTALSAAAADAQARSATAANAATLANTAATNSLGAFYTSASGAAALAVLTSTLAAQSASALEAHNNEIVLKLRAAYKADSHAKAAVISAKYAVYLAKSALDARVAAGATVSQIKTLQSVLQEANTILADEKAKATRKAAALTQMKEWATLEPNTITIMTAAMDAANDATKAEAIEVLVTQFMEILQTKDSANSAFNAANAKYTLSNTALNTAIMQGSSIEDIQTARLIVQADSVKLANARAELNLAEAAVTAAYNNLAGYDASGSLFDVSGGYYVDASGNYILDPSGNRVNLAALEILNNATIVQNRAIANAEARALIVAYTNAFAVYQAAKTTHDTAVSASLVANNNLDQAITAGASLADIKTLRDTAQAAANDMAAAKSAMDNALNASNANRAAILSHQTFDLSGNAISDASGNLAASAAALALLIQEQANQATAIANAQANSLLVAYLVVLNRQTAVNNTLSNDQAAYDAAATALNQAITGGATVTEIQALQTTAQNAGQRVANTQTLANAVANAVDLAEENVSSNAHATYILNKVQEYQSGAASLAAANNFIGLLEAAKTNVATKLNTLTLSQNASRIAREALDAAITAGTDIANIQELQRTVVSTAAAQSTAQVTYDQAILQLNQAQQSANSNVVANTILNNQTIFAAQKQHLAAVNSATAEREAARAANVVAQARLVSANAALVSATVDVSGAVAAGKTQAEIVDLQTAAAAAATAAAAAANAGQAAATNLLNKQNALTALQSVTMSVPDLTMGLYYELKCVELNESQIVSDPSGCIIYVNDPILVSAATGFTAPGFSPVSRITWTSENGQVQGVGVGSATRILSMTEAASVPGGLYSASTCVAIKLDKLVTAVDGIFYLVGGENTLYNFILQAGRVAVTPE
jgi:trimeric autotransporter adhesin